jgi:hypothetical protein
MPWAIRLKNLQTSTPLCGCPYKLVHDGKTIFQGYADKHGYTMTQNVDYFGEWEVVVPPQSEGACFGPR